MMGLAISIVLGIILGFVIFMEGQELGMAVAFGVIAGCLFRILYLLNEINKRLKGEKPKRDKVAAVYEDYLREKQNREQNDTT